MKLIRCYIENFGGLSQYSQAFSPGLTVICQPNGFGKTTLAEFIRAMFYGFPRATKKAEKNLRKKYQPWQGGKCGGYLIFEHQGKRYRIDRTFGDTPRTDTFSLTDPDTHKKCGDFSEDIGKELFGLDSDSFERSTYAPQRQDAVSLSSANIRAKLGNLLEDTEDINRYDKALDALRTKRSSLIPYKGSGGTVAEAARQISMQELALDQAKATIPQLQTVTAQLQEAYENRDKLSARLESVRGEITAAAQYEAVRSIHSQYGALCRSREDCREQLDTLSHRYPAGLPTPDELEIVDRQAASLRVLETQTADPSGDAEAEALVEQNRDRFSAGIPDDDTFEKMRRYSTQYIEAQSLKNSIRESPEDAACLEKLQARFAGGVPEEACLCRCQDLAFQLAALPQEDEAPLSQEEDLLEQNLKVFFAEGVPAEADITRNQTLADQAAALRQESLAIAASWEDAARRAPPPKAKQPSGWLLPALGMLLAAVGAVLLVLSLTVAGAAALCLGLVLVLAGVFGKMKGDLRKEFAAAPTMGEAERQQILQNNTRAAQLEQTVQDFVGVYISDSRSLVQKLAVISDKRKQYLALKTKREEARNRTLQLRARRRDLEGQLQQLLAPYAPAGETPTARIETLKNQIHTYFHLSRQREVRQNTLREAEEILSRLCRRLSDFLLPYFGGNMPDDIPTAIYQLERDCQSYCDAVNRLRERDQRREDRARKTAECRKKLADFAEKYALSQDLQKPEALSGLRRDLQQYTHLQSELKRCIQAAEAFRQEHQALLSQSPEQPSAAAQDLTGLETELAEQLGKAEKSIAALAQQQRLLAAQTDRIPELEDQLVRLRESMEADTRRSRMLDQTMHCLREARDSLTGRYLGPIQTYFQDYLHRITGEDQNNIAISTELEVSLSRMGQHRGMVNFSAGQADIVWICMHLALADSMFRDEGSPLILDDPFVNLDDRNLEQALELLKDLATDHQILYLTCHSGRI